MTRSRVLWGAAGLVLLAGCALAAVLLWRTSVPGAVLGHAPDPRSLFSAAQLSQGRSFERFRAVDFLLAQLAMVAVLVVYARRGAVLMRESAAGRIGTGMLLAMLGFALVWLAQLPFGVAELWWERRHHLASASYAGYILGNFLGLGGRFVFVCLAILIVMALARPLRRLWWVAAVPVFAALAVLQAFVAPYLVTSTHRLADPRLTADAAVYARELGLGKVPVEVQEVHRYTSQPNAEAVGFGASQRVILWDTLLLPGFTTRQRAAVVAHEMGHLARDHILKSVAWYALFAVPIALVVAVATRSRGGMYEPAAVPVAILAFAVLQLVALPVHNAIQRRYETEADWTALRLTRDPVAQRELMQRLAVVSHDDPRPPWWDYVLLQDHPTIVQRIGMAQAAAGRLQ